MRATARAIAVPPTRWHRSRAPRSARRRPESPRTAESGARGGPGAIVSALLWLLRWAAADELHRCRPRVLDRVRLVRPNPEDRSRRERLLTLRPERHPLPLQEIHLLLVPVLMVGRARPGGDLEHAHREVLRPAPLVDHPVDPHPRHPLRGLRGDLVILEPVHRTVPPIRCERVRVRRRPPRSCYARP